MKIKSYETFKCDAGWRTFSFLKMVTDDGIVGWSEYNESFGSPGLAGVIDALMPSVIGQDPMALEPINAVLATRSTQSRGGVVRQAIAAIENALLDIKGKALGVPVYQLFGGKLRDRIPVYWSHCGSYRMRNADAGRRAGGAHLRRHDEGRRRGEGQGLHARSRPTSRSRSTAADHAYRPGFVVGRGFPERNWDAFIARSAAKTVEAFRKGCGPDVGIMLDTNFHFRTEGFRRIAEAVGPTGLTWLELDAHDPKSIALIRRDAPCPIASGETLLERRDFRPYLRGLRLRHRDRRRGLERLLRIAEDRGDGRRLRGERGAAQFLRPSRAAPSARISAPPCRTSASWRSTSTACRGATSIVAAPPVIENGDYVLPTGPGWGVEVNEAAVRARPPKRGERRDRVRRMARELPARS